MKTTHKQKLARKMLTKDEIKRGVSPFHSKGWRQHNTAVLYREGKRNRNHTPFIEKLGEQITKFQSRKLLQEMPKERKSIFSTIPIFKKK